MLFVVFYRCFYNVFCAFVVFQSAANKKEGNDQNDELGLPYVLSTSISLHLLVVPFDVENSMWI